MHDEYWTKHVDKRNTEHYDYSGLLCACQAYSCGSPSACTLDRSRRLPCSRPGPAADLSTYGEDFQGGKFVFYDEGSNHTIEPRAGTAPSHAVPTRSFSVLRIADTTVPDCRLPGRFLTFSAGDENLHQVQRVESGTRLTMSMWFTCDSTREFTTFLDGKVHSTFKHAPAQSTGSSDEL